MFPADVSGQSSHGGVVRAGRDLAECRACFVLRVGSLHYRGDTFPEIPAMTQTDGLADARSAARGRARGSSCVHLYASWLPCAMSIFGVGRRCPAIGCVRADTFFTQSVARHARRRNVVCSGTRACPRRSANVYQRVLLKRNAEIRFGNTWRRKATAKINHSIIKKNSTGSKEIREKGSKGAKSPA